MSNAKMAPLSGGRLLHPAFRFEQPVQRSITFQGSGPP